jgi:transcriptional regulator with XRE-family HTH domain
MRIDPSELGSAIRRIRRLRRLTQEIAAKRVGVSSNYLSLLENGQRGATIDTLNALAQVLGVPTSFLTFLGSKASGDECGSAAFSELVDTTKAAVIAAIGAQSEAGADNLTS